MTLSFPINDKYFHEWVSQTIVFNLDISFCSENNLVVISNLCLGKRSVVFKMDWQLILLIPLLQSWTFSKSYNVFFIFCNIWNSFLSFFAPDHSPDSRMIFILLTIPILLHRFQRRIVQMMPLLENRYQVAPVCHEASPHSQRIARFRHEGVPRDRIQVEFSSVALQKVSSGLPIARTSQYQFSTFEKTMHGYHHILSNLLMRLFPSIAHDNSGWKFRVSPIPPLSQQLYSRVLFSMNSLPRAYWSRRWYVRRRPWYKIHHWSRFCCDSFFSWMLWDRFVIFSEHTVELKWLKLNKHSKWFHKRVIFPWLGFQQVGFLVLMCWIWSSRLIRLNNQWSATCWSWKNIIVGLLPYKIILINASLTPSIADDLDQCFVVLKHTQ